MCRLSDVSRTYSGGTSKPAPGGSRGQSPDGNQPVVTNKKPPSAPICR